MPQSIIADALQEVLDEGLVKAVGVCNYNAKQLTELQGLLQKKGTSLATNQVSQQLFLHLVKYSAVHSAGSRHKPPLALHH